MSIINRWSESISKLVEASFKVSSSIAKHSLILGDAREKFIRDILKNFLPANIVIGTGQIVDQDDNLSNQIDIIIYRNDFPVLRTLGTADIYLLEGVIATIEVKSTLNKKTLFEALENCKSVRQLKARCLGISLDRYTDHIYNKSYKDLPENKKDSIDEILLPQTFIFSYNGFPKSSLNRFSNLMNEWFNNPEEDGQQNMICLPEVIVSKGCVAVKNHSNFLGLNKANQIEVMETMSQVNSLIKKRKSKQPFFGYYTFCQKLDPENKGFNYGMALKDTNDPLKYLISSLLECIFNRNGHQQLGQTGIQYDLISYHTSFDMNYNWKGAVVNLHHITDPKLEYMNYK